MPAEFDQSVWKERSQAIQQRLLRPIGLSLDDRQVLQRELYEIERQLRAALR